MDVSIKDKDKTQQELLLQALDRGIDDIQSGRIYSVDEAFRKVNDIRQMRKNDRDKRY
jgi:hypothetical protein